MSEPSELLVRRRSGRLGGLVVAVIFVLAPLVAASVGVFQVESMRSWTGVSVVLRFGLFTIPFALMAVAAALSHSELVLDREARVLRHTSHRPWRKSDRNEIAFERFAGVRAEGPDQELAGRYLVMLVQTDGEELVLRLFRSAGEAVGFAEKVARHTGLWFRSSMGSVATPTDSPDLRGRTA